jgi:hypothetical protein
MLKGSSPVRTKFNTSNYGGREKLHVCVTGLSWLMFPDTYYNTALLEGAKSVPTFPSDDSSIKTNMSMAHWWNDADGKKHLSTQTETCPCATLSTTNVTQTDPGSNPGFGD